MDNMIDLALIRFPVGSKAWHPSYRICYIVKCEGCMRIIKSFSLDTDDRTMQYNTVHVSELQKLALIA